MTTEQHLISTLQFAVTQMTTANIILNDAGMAAGIHLIQDTIDDYKAKSDELRTKS